MVTSYLNLHIALFPILPFFDSLIHGSRRVAKLGIIYHMNDNIRWTHDGGWGEGPHSNNALDFIKCSTTTLALDPRRS